MSRVIEFQKNLEGKIIINNQYEILQFTDDGMPSGQSAIAFSIDHGAGKRFITQKFYGLRSKIKETAQSRFSLSTSREYAQRVMQHEIDILRPLEVLFPAIPMLLTSGEYNGVPYVNLTNGKESKVIPSEDTEIEQFSMRDYKQGGVLSLEQVNHHKEHALNTQQALLKIDEIRNWDIRKKVEFFIEYIKIVNNIHKDYGVINKDIKPHHLLILSPRYSAKPQAQIIDWASSIQINHLDNMKDFLLSPTTIAYNHPDILNIHLQSLEHKNTSGIFSNLKENPQQLFSWDNWSLGLCGLEFITGRSPYTNTAISIISKNKNICEHEKSLLSLVDQIESQGIINPTIESEIIHVKRKIDFEKTACFIEAQNRYLEERKEPGYMLRRNDLKIPGHIEKIFHAMLDEPGSNNRLSLEDVIDELTPHTYSTGKRMSRRVFCGRGLAFIAATIASGTGIYEIAKKIDSPAHLNSNLINESIKTGHVDKNDLKYLVKRVIEEQWMAPMKKTMQLIREKNEFSNIPAKVEDGEYQFDESRVLEAGYFPRMLLLSGLMLEREDLIKDYLFVIGKLQFSPGDGYRIFRIMDPLEEFRTVASQINASEELTEKSSALLKQCKQYIMQEHLTEAAGMTYFKAYTKDIPAKGFKHIIRPAYHIVKYMADHAPKEYESHMEALEKFIVKNGLTIDAVSFNGLDDRRPGVINTLKGVYESVENHGFYANACEQVLMIDLFSDYYLKTGKGKNTFEGLWNKYKQNVNEYGPSVEFLNAPKHIRSFNNSPFIVNTNTITEKRSLFGLSTVHNNLVLMHNLAVKYL